jgi:hypothetical protein
MAVIGECHAAVHAMGCERIAVSRSRGDVMDNAVIALRGLLTLSLYLVLNYTNTPRPTSVSVRAPTAALPAAATTPRSSASRTFCLPASKQ